MTKIEWMNGWIPNAQVEFLRGGGTEVASEQENCSIVKSPARVAISLLPKIEGMYVSLPREVENAGWRHIHIRIIDPFRLISISNVEFSPTTWEEICLCVVISMKVLLYLLQAYFLR